jgi:hypothetical protein
MNHFLIREYQECRFILDRRAQDESLQHAGDLPA